MGTGPGAEIESHQSRRRSSRPQPEKCGRGRASREAGGHLWRPGSGKTSLAIDTLYAEGQRRYIESFSAYTRQFLERLDKPDYDRIDGLPPALAVTRGRPAEIAAR